MTKRLIDAEPEAVYAVLADPFSYQEWVVGASETRRVDVRWPQAGSRFHHTQGLPWIGPQDTTSVLEADPPHRLRLRVRVRPFIVGEVELDLRPSNGMTLVTMRENPVAGLLGRLHNPLFDIVIYLRNVESLRRLEKLVRQQAPLAEAAAR